MSDMERAFDTIEKARVKYRAEIKEMENRHKQLEGEREAVLFDHTAKLMKLKDQNNREMQAAKMEIEPLRLQLQNLKSEVDAARLALDKARQERLDTISRMRAEELEAIYRMDQKIEEKQAILNRIMTAIEEARIRIGVE